MTVTERENERERLRRNWESIRQRIEVACGRVRRDPAEVMILPVTKTHPASTIRAAMELGLGPFGENYVQELAVKAEELPEARWHFIGHLQRNKVRHLPETCRMIETVDSARLLETIERRFPSPIDCLVEVHLSGEESKTGISAELLPDLLRAADQYPKPRIRGLMTMAPYECTAQEARAVFRRLRLLRDEINTMGILKHPLTQLSMGMSSDFETAVEEGSTLVRIGSALFGEREYL